MSEEVKSAFKLFAQSQMTYSEAEEKAKSEAGRPKVERYRIGEDGEYSIRILPLAPVLDANGNPLPMDRKGYEYPIHQLFLGITLPAKKGKKSKKISIPVIRATDKGVDKSVDLIDTYLKIVKEKYSDDEALVASIDANSFSGGIRWSYQHAIMVLDLSNEKTRAKGPQIWQCSHSQYKDLDAARLRLWAELREDGEQETCPISWFVDAYPVKIIRKTDNKTEYTVEIGRKTVDVHEDEVQKLLDLPRIPEIVNRFTRYQMEAEIVFLQQYDQLHDIDVCSEPDFIEAVETLKGEMSVDDTSHFELSKADNTSTSSEAVTIDSLWDEYDRITDEGFGEKSDEYQELREKIRQFAEDNDLDVRLSRTKKNKQLLDEISEALEEAEKQADSADEKEDKSDDSEKEDEKPTVLKRKSRPVVEEDDEDDNADENNGKEDEDVQNKTEEKESGEEPEDDEQPVRRRRRRTT